MLIVVERLLEVAGDHPQPAGVREVRLGGLRVVLRGTDAAADGMRIVSGIATLPEVRECIRRPG